MATHRRRRPVTENLPTRELTLPASLPPGVSRVEVRRSARRRKTVSARVEGDTAVLLLPDGMSRADEQRWVTTMVARLASRRHRAPGSDDELAARAAIVARRHLEPAVGQALRPTSVRWVTTMNQRWASCSTDAGTIRVSHRLQQMPDWVLDYVLAHELVHLLVPDHGPRFQELLAHYPQAERARGYLEGWSAASGRGCAEPEGDFD
ncbi:M48 metallopeptidase family protein [Brooklawnia cerclae]|uniref:YgjP-like metallopeptidase domain-containing protein n=1 Tax=Brooklawnia cerclae TaxID=349934 RepID=A0ABX0SHZ7_9ACTN|nr:M48 family metallopeptidase [Brooklawnia cerclae]NIH56376.1 hypothetical protein [Brooklawnia cerclae]